MRILPLQLFALAALLVTGCAGKGESSATVDLQLTGDNGMSALHVAAPRFSEQNLLDRLNGRGLPVSVVIETSGVRTRNTDQEQANELRVKLVTQTRLKNEFRVEHDRVLRVTEEGEHEILKLDAKDTRIYELASRKMFDEWRAAAEGFGFLETR